MSVLPSLTCALGLVSGVATAASTEDQIPFRSTAMEAASPPLVLAAQKQGRLALDIDTHTWAERGLQFDAPAANWELPVLPQGKSAVTLGDGAPTAWQGRLDVPGLGFTRVDGARTPPLSLVPGGMALEADLVDETGAVWARLRDPMRSPDERDGWRLITANLLAGPALAGWLGAPVEGALLAGARMQIPLRTAASPKTCSVPVWPGSAGTTTDVLLTSIAGTQSPRCKRSDSATVCDGPGGDPGQVIIAANATLANRDAADAADVPWYQQFSGSLPPYGNDQHPFLVWNLYRVDADGLITQIGRSALKHAFATANTGCTDATCVGNSQILGRGCADVYPVSSNDCNRFLAPRDEVWPSRGIWGRCGSLFDADCDGIADARTSGAFCSGVIGSPANDGYGLRLMMDEREIDPAGHPGARWFFDSWYVIRDDEEPFNTMGWREIFPSYVPGVRWQFTENPYQVGSIAEWWSTQGGVGDDRAWTLVDTGEGLAGIAARVTEPSAGTYRYDYVIMNFSLTRPITQGAEPNLRLLRNLGIDAISLSRAAQTKAGDFEFVDGDADAGNDWAAGATVGSWTWAAPSGGEFPWGSMIRIALTSTHAPHEGVISLHMAEPGTPALYQAVVPVPDAVTMLRSGFE